MLGFFGKAGDEEARSGGFRRVHARSPGTINKGNALAMATAMPPLRRETADRLVSDVVDSRARRKSRREMGIPNRNGRDLWKLRTRRGAPKRRGYRMRLSSAIQG